MLPAFGGLLLAALASHALAQTLTITELVEYTTTKTATTVVSTPYSTSFTSAPRAPVTTLYESYTTTTTFTYSDYSYTTYTTTVGQNEPTPNPTPNPDPTPGPIVTPTPNQEPAPSPAPIPPPIDGESSTTTTSTSTTAKDGLPTPSLPQIGDDRGDPRKVGTPFVPEDLAVDEKVVYLTYLANYNRDECLAKAAEFGDQAGPYARRRLAAMPVGSEVSSPSLAKRLVGGIAGSFGGVLPKPPKRPTYNPTVPTGCVPSSVVIPMTVHWVIPADADPMTWAVDRRQDFIDGQMVSLNNIYKKMNMFFDLRQQYYWSGKNWALANEFTRMVKGDPLGLEFVATTRQRAKSTSAAHLNIYIVEDILSDDDDPPPGGYCKFAGVSRTDRNIRENPDACVIRRDQIQLLDDLVIPSPQYDSYGTTVPHEVGHWLNLYHLHQDGCDSKYQGDLISSTPRYGPDGFEADYSKDCDGKKRTEYNIMSYSTAVTRKELTLGFTYEQRIRAMTGLVMRRTGYTNQIDKGVAARDRSVGAVKRYLLDYCYTFDAERNVLAKRQNSLRDDLATIAPLTKRQAAAAFSRFCDSTDLTFKNYQLSTWANDGIYNISAKLGDEWYQEDLVGKGGPAPFGQVDEPLAMDADAFNEPIVQEFQKSGKIDTVVSSASTASSGATHGMTPRHSHAVLAVAVATLLALL